MKKEALGLSGFGLRIQRLGFRGGSGIATRVEGFQIKYLKGLGRFLVVQVNAHQIALLRFTNHIGCHVVSVGCKTDLLISINRNMDQSLLKSSPVGTSRKLAPCDEGTAPVRDSPAVLGYAPPVRGRTCNPFHFTGVVLRNDACIMTYIYV